MNHDIYFSSRSRDITVKTLKIVQLYERHVRPHHRIVLRLSLMCKFCWFFHLTNQFIFIGRWCTMRRHSERKQRRLWRSIGISIPHNLWEFWNLFRFVLLFFFLGGENKYFFTRICFYRYWQIIVVHSPNQCVKPTIPN